MLLRLLLVVMRWLWTRLSMVVHSRRCFLSASGSKIIDSSLKIDEEGLPHYKASCFYPVYLCSIFDSRYQVLSKLGYSSCSTIWLLRDVMFVQFHSHISELTNLCCSEQKYVALKVCISNYPSIERERAAYVHLREVLRTSTASLESLLVCTSLAEFEIPGLNGKHWCFAFEPLTIDLVTTRASVRFDEVVFKTVAFHVFRALEFLHTKAQMVHCGASPFFMTFVSCNPRLRSSPGKLLSHCPRSIYFSKPRGIWEYMPFRIQNLQQSNHLLWSWSGHSREYSTFRCPNLVRFWRGPFWPGLLWRLNPALHVSSPWGCFHDSLVLSHRYMECWGHSKHLTSLFIWQKHSCLILLSAMGPVQEDKTAFSGLPGTTKLSTTCGRDGRTDGQTTSILPSALTIWGASELD